VVVRAFAVGGREELAVGTLEAVPYVAVPSRGKGGEAKVVVVVVVMVVVVMVAAAAAAVVVVMVVAAAAAAVVVVLVVVVVMMMFVTEVVVGKGQQKAATAVPHLTTNKSVRIKGQATSNRTHVTTRRVAPSPEPRRSCSSLPASSLLRACTMCPVSTCGRPSSSTLATFDKITEERWDARTRTGREWKLRAADAAS